MKKTKEEIVRLIKEYNKNNDYYLVLVYFHDNSFNESIYLLYKYSLINLNNSVNNIITEYNGVYYLNQKPLDNKIDISKNDIEYYRNNLDLQERIIISQISNSSYYQLYKDVFELWII